MVVAAWCALLSCCLWTFRWCFCWVGFRSWVCWFEFRVVWVYMVVYYAECGCFVGDVLYVWFWWFWASCLVGFGVWSLIVQLLLVATQFVYDLMCCVVRSSWGLFRAWRRIFVVCLVFWFWGLLLWVLCLGAFGCFVALVVVVVYVWFGLVGVFCCFVSVGGGYLLIFLADLFPLVYAGCWFVWLCWWLDWCRDLGDYG